MAASLADLRDALGLSTPELAEKAGVDRSHLWRILSGKRPATSEVIAACLVALGAEVNARAAA